MNIQQLRHKHKSAVVQHAFKITGHHKDFPAAKKFESEWVDYLLQGNEITQFLTALKNSKPIKASDLAPLDLNSFDASTSSVVTSQPSLKIQAGESADIQVSIYNGSNAIWQSDEKTPIRLSYHWYYANGELCEFDGERTILSRPLFPGKTCTSIIKIKPPKEAGDYFLEVTLVWEGVCWFEERGLPLHRIPVQVDRQKLPPHAQRIYQALVTEIKKAKKEVV